MKQKFSVTGMTCSACSAHVEKAVLKLPGIKTAEVNLLAGTMQAEYDEIVIDAQAICQAVHQAGYGATVFNNKAKKDETANKAKEHKMKIRLTVSIVFLIPLLYIAMGHMVGWPLPQFLLKDENILLFALLQLILLLPIVYANRSYYRTGFRSLKAGAPNMDSLIALSSSAAIIYGLYAIIRIAQATAGGDIALAHAFGMDIYFESAGTILTLITVGKYLEERSKGQTSQALDKLAELAPDTVFVLRDGKEEEISTDDLKKGDIVAVYPGMRIAADGIITEGSSSVDESLITGESMPVNKTVGDEVICATINQSGYFLFKATKVGDETTLANIMSLVEQASASKAPIAKLADKISGIFVPIVMGIALLTTVIWLLSGHNFTFALSCGIAVLVISCPCALGLATPVAIMVATGKAAEHGILIKSAEALQALSSVNNILFDKTGTLTQGKTQVTDIIPADEQTNEDELLQITAALEQRSEHVLAQAILSKARERQLMLPDISDFTSITGQGISGTLGADFYLAGNSLLMEQHHIELPDTVDFANSGKTVLYIAKNERLYGIIAVADIVRPETITVCQTLQKNGYNTIMLTGDNQITANAIAKKINVNNVKAQLLPGDKEKIVSELRAEGHKTAMVGDGINDAPALAAADVGIAIGAGKDIAIEAADIVLMSDDLQNVPAALSLGRKTMRNIRENLFWAFIYNIVGIPLAAGALYIPFGIKLSPMFAALAMSLSSLCVVTNALRLRSFKPDKKTFTTTEQAKQDLTRDMANNNIDNNKGVHDMKKTIGISDMTCPHCQARVEKALTALGVKAVVDLDAKEAYVTMATEVSDDVLRKTVENAGYTVTYVQKNQ